MLIVYCLSRVPHKHTVVITVVMIMMMGNVPLTVCDGEIKEKKGVTREQDEIRGTC